MVEYRLEECRIQDRVLGYQIHVIVDGFEACDTLKFKDYDLAEKFMRNMEFGDQNREMYVRQGVQPFIRNKLQDAVHLFLEERIYAGELERRIQDFKKMLDTMYGCIPDQKMIDDFSQYDYQTKEEKEKWIQMVFHNQPTDIQQELIDQWITGKIRGEAFVLRLLALRQKIG